MCTVTVVKLPRFAIAFAASELTVELTKGLFIARVNEGFEDDRFSNGEINTYTSGILSLIRLYSAWRNRRAVKHGINGYTDP